MSKKAKCQKMSRHCQGENSSILIHKMYKEKFIKWKIVNLQMRKTRMNRQDEKY